MFLANLASNLECHTATHAKCDAVGNSAISRSLSALTFLTGGGLLALAVLLVGPNVAFAQKSAQAASDPALSQRIGRIEQRLTDLQGAIGAFQSMAGGRASAPAGNFSGGADSERIEVLETQIQALSGQIQQLSSDIAALRNGGQRRGGRDRNPSGQGQNSFAPQQGFGGQLQPQSWQQPQNLRSGQGQMHTASLPSNPAAKASYSAAHKFIIRQDYRKAEQAFSGFLQRFSGDPLAANARYWLGESHYMRGQYRPAAQHFLKGVRQHKGAARAPDMLLRLGMSFARLGQSAGACKTFLKLSQQYPAADGHIRRQATNEKRRLGC